MLTPRSATPLGRDELLDYFRAGAVPRAEWKIGMEVEKLGRRAADGRSLPYDGETASVRKVLEFILAERGGSPVYEADNLIGIDAPWGGISLEPGGQVEWSSRPVATLAELHDLLAIHLATLGHAGAALGVRWLDVAVDPELPVSEMSWMPKARYKVMRSYLGQRGRLAHRMMTQTASVQCAFDYADAHDWKRKFRVAALAAPLATALFANSSRVDGRDSGYRCYRQAIWAETDPERCGLPPVVFDPAFDVERWLDWMLSVPTLFLHRARGLVPSGGVPFARLLERTGCESVTPQDWETQVSTIFTEVRSYTYLEVRSADLQPDDLCFAVPAFWTGLLYDEAALDEIPRLLASISDASAWRAAMAAAARSGLDGEVPGLKLRDAAHVALRLAAAGLVAAERFVGATDEAAESLVRLGATRGLTR